MRQRRAVLRAGSCAIKGLTDKTAIRVETLSGVIEPQLTASGEVTVDMGAPLFDPAQVPFDTAGLVPRAEHQEVLWPLPLGDRELWIARAVHGQSARSAAGRRRRRGAGGSRRAVDRDAIARFPQRVNAGFMQIVDAHALRLRVWERGAGETLACGTGACAAVVSGIRRGILQSPVARVDPRRYAFDRVGRRAGVDDRAGDPVFEGEIDL